LSTVDEFQKRITKLEVAIVEIKKALEEIAKATPKPTLPEASDYVPEEGIAEEAVEEATSKEEP